ncbi:A/G-specific adenine glycosylase [bacterium]|nr:A/G-specific adenine glycosylase [bacterium]
MKPSSKQIQSLHSWYISSKRALPWRSTKDAYKIWISETMLQQTTTQAVIPFYEKFIQRFPNLKSLALADQGEVFSLWSGLGYYSRAKNLHRAAKELLKMPQFPKSHEELQKLPGFGPYTSRAVSSLAFEENVGVLDGNVIRILSRIHDLKLEWWKSAPRKKFQELADLWVQGPQRSSEMNQAMMELGAVICTPKSPSCLLCPLKTSCLARRSDTIEARPLQKPKREKVLLLWSVQTPFKNSQVYLDQKHNYPILKSQPLPLGEMKVISKKPKSFHFKHAITHHEIYVVIDSTAKRRKAEDGAWVELKNLPRISPNSLVKKVVTFLETQNRS